MNPKKIFPFFWIFLLFLLQNAIGFIFAQKLPVLLLIGVLFYALSEGPWYGAVLGAYAGGLLEIFGQGRMGCEILVFSAAGFIFGRTARTFFRESLFAQVLFPALIFYFVAITRLAVYQITLGEGWDFSLFREVALSYEVLLVFAAAPVVFFFLKKVS